MIAGLFLFCAQAPDGGNARLFKTAFFLSDDVLRPKLPPVKNLVNFVILASHVTCQRGPAEAEPRIALKGGLLCPLSFSDP